MRVRCFGARGSVPVSGERYLRYGGDTPCLEIRSKNGEILVIDAGTGIRRLGLELAREGRASLTLLFTHTHWDHIQGLPFFRPLFDPGARIALGGCPGLHGDLPKLLGRAMSPPLFPVHFSKVPASVEPFVWCTDTLWVDTLKITRIPLSHPNLGAGYRVEEDGRSLVFLTDNELSHHHRGGRSMQDYADFCRGADMLIHDAEYTPEEYPQRRSWGHSHVADAARLAVLSGVGRFGLFHHNQDRADDEVDALVARCQGLVDAAHGQARCEGVSHTSVYEF